MGKANDRQERAARAEQMRKEREKAERRQRNVITVAIVTVVVVLLGLGGFAVKSQLDQNADDRALNTPENTTDDYGIVYSAADAADGGEGGASESPAAAEGEPVSVELYEDFQCPACQSFEQASGQFLKQQVQAGAVEITYKPYSFLDSASQNEYSSRATNIALCVLDAGGVQDYVKFHDYLYANQPPEQSAGPEDPELIEAAEGLGITGIEECAKGERFQRWIEDARQAGTERGVSGTPAVFVDGKQIENPSPAGLQQAIAAAQKG